MSIGQRLKEARLASKMTQPQLAEAVHVTKGANYLYQDYIHISEEVSTEEKHLLDLYRGADDRAKEDAIRTLSEHQKKDSLSKAE